MSRYYIEDVKCNILSGGPDPGIVCTSVKYSDGKAAKWLTNVEVDGLPNFYLTDDDLFDRIMADDDDEEFDEYRDAHFIEEFDGIGLGEYEEIVDALTEKEEAPAASLIKYVIAVTRSDMERTQELIRTGKGKNADELKITMEDLDLDE